MILIIPPSSSNPYLPFSLGIGYLASVIKSLNKEVKVLNCSGMKNWKEILKNWITTSPTPLYVGITTDVSNIGNACEISRFVKRYSSVKIIFGGPYASAIYKELIPQNCDVVVIGEGERTIVDLIQQKELKEIKGIAYWEDELKITPPQELIDDLDTLPYPLQVPGVHSNNLDYESEQTLRSIFWTSYIITSRGCPYQCINCTKVVHGYKLRLRSTENVLEEIDFLVKILHTKRIEIHDDNFTFYPDRVEKICELIIKRNYKNLTFSLPNGIRVDKGDMKMFQLLKRANFNEVSIAVETSSQEIADKLGRNVDLSKVVDTFRIAKKVGLITHAFFIWGLPFDTKQTMYKTMKLAKKLEPDVCFFFMLRPFPGTKLYDYILQNGKFLHNIVENYPSYYKAEMIYEMEGINKEEVEDMFIQAYLSFYFRLRYVFNLIRRNFTTKIKTLSFLYGFFLKDLLKDAIARRFKKGKQKNK